MPLPRRPSAAAPHAWLGALLLLLATVPGTSAQDPPGPVGLGLQFGAPTGVTVKLYKRPTFAYSILVAWDLDAFFFLSTHGVVEQRFDTSPLGLFVGPGLILGIDRRDPVLGISGQIGTNFYRERFEVFIQATPRLRLTPDVLGDWGAGIGLRYFFRQRSASETVD